MAAGVILRQFPLPGHPLTREDAVSLVVATADAAQASPLTCGSPPRSSPPTRPTSRGALALCEQGGADLIHFDVMDGHFVPNLTFGIPVLKALQARTRLPFDVHLMVTTRTACSTTTWRPARRGWPSTGRPRRTSTALLERIRKAGAKAGVAVNPATPVELLVDALPRLDYVLLMSVNPGFRRPGVPAPRPRQGAPPAAR